MIKASFCSDGDVWHDCGDDIRGTMQESFRDDCELIVESIGNALDTFKETAIVDPERSQEIINLALRLQ